MKLSSILEGIPLTGLRFIQNPSVSIKPPPSDSMRTRIVHHLLDNPEHHLRMRTRAGQLTGRMTSMTVRRHDPHRVGSRCAARIEIVETDVLQITCNAIESHRPGDVDISRPYRPRGFEHPRHWSANPPGGGCASRQLPFCRSLRCDCSLRYFAHPCCNVVRSLRPVPHQPPGLPQSYPVVRARSPNMVNKEPIQSRKLLHCPRDCRLTFDVLSRSFLSVPKIVAAPWNSHIPRLGLEAPRLAAVPTRAFALDLYLLSRFVVQLLSTLVVRWASAPTERLGRR